MCCNFPKAARERRVVLERGGLVQPPSLLTNYLEADIPGGLAEFGFDPHAPTLIIWEGNTIVPASREHHAPWQDILDLAYYSGWRKNEILGLTWDELDEAGGVIRLSPARSKTLVGRILPISQPIAEALARRRARRDPDSPLVFHRDGIPVRRWRTAWRTACQAAGVPTRFLHDCRRTAARNLIRASVPERVAMLLTGHKTRAIFDRYNIIHEQELLEAGDQLVAYLAQHAQATPRGGRPHPARTAAPRSPFASCDAPPRKAHVRPHRGDPPVSVPPPRRDSRGPSRPARHLATVARVPVSPCIAPP